MPLGKTRCKCGAVMEWAMTPGGSKIPVDSELYPDGNLYLERDGGRLIAHARGKLNPADASRTFDRKSHFATCPNASEFRKPWSAR